MAVKFTNNAKTTLASGINSSVTTATVTDGSVFPTLDAGEHFYCTFDDGTNNEIVKVTARSGNTLTIIRGVDNTTARSFSSGDAAELRATSALLTDIQENIAAKSANQTVYNTTTASSATDYDIGIDPSVEANAMVFLNGVMQHHDTFSFSGSTLTFDTAPPDGMALEVIVDNLINLQSSNLTVDTFTAADVGGNPQTDFTLSDAPAAEDNLLVFIDGVFQDQDAYTISNQTLTITDGVTADFGVTVYVINPVNIGTPSDGTVTSSKLSGNITMPADLTVTGDVAFDSPTFVVDNANSRVGIGTASPSTLLDIVGDVKMSANLTVDTNTLHVDATNNYVGVGTTSPSAPLHVAGNIQTDNFYRGYDSVSGNYRNLLGYDSGNVKIQTGTGSTTYGVSIFTAGTERFHINGSGNVGIGTSSPSQVLHVKDADYTRIQIEAGTTGYGAILNLGDSSDADYGSITQFASAAGEGGRMRFVAGATETMNLRGGNVGIGTNSPSAPLHVKAASPNILLEGTSFPALKWAGTDLTTDAEIYYGIGGNDLNINNYNSGIIAFKTNSSERMRIDSSGNVGIGTTSPDHILCIEGTEPTFRIFDAANTLNQEQTIAFGTEPGNRTHAEIAGININTGNAEGALSFKTNSGASLTERLRIDSSGNVGIGITSQSGVRLYVDAPAATHASVFRNSQANFAPIVVDNTATSGTRNFTSFRINNTEVGKITSTGSSTTYATTSDYRAKENVVEMTGALDRVNQLQPKRFNFISDADTTVDGFIAHEVQDIVPEAITGEKDAVKEEEYEITPAVLDDDGNVVTEAEMGTREVPDYQGIDQSKLVPLLTKAIQEQQELINNLTARIETLEG